MAPCLSLCCCWMSIFICLISAVKYSRAVNGRKIFCYYSSFAYTRQGRGNFLPEDINPHLCTHIIYAFVDISPDGSHLVPFSKIDQGPKGLYSRTLALKEKNPHLKVLLAVGGWLIGSEPFLPAVKSEKSRSVWVQNVIKYLRKHGFDGFDMDWEFPATRGSPPQDKFRFTQLMKTLYEAFAKESEESGKDKLLLTMATASGTYYISQSYEHNQIIKYLDYMLLMTYNYHGQWEKKTGHHSGLYPHRNDPKHGEKSQLYQEWSIDFWLDAGISKDKLIVGIPTYAMTFTLADQSQHDPHAVAVAGGKQGEFTQETGILAYYEVCERLKDRGWQAEWIEEQGVPFAYGGDQWAGFENKRSVTLKAKNIVKRDLGGAFVWSVEMGDFDGYCGQGPYPLLQAINDVFKHGNPSEAASKTIQDFSKPKRVEQIQRKDTSVTRKISQRKTEQTVTKSSHKKRKVRVSRPNRTTRKGTKRLSNLKKRTRIFSPSTQDTTTTRAVTPRASKTAYLEQDRPFKKIRWLPGDASRRRKIKALPPSDRLSLDDKRFHSVASITRKLTLGRTQSEAEDNTPSTPVTVWWSKPSDSSPADGWTKLFLKGRKSYTSGNSAHIKEVSPSRDEHASGQRANQKGAASASAGDSLGAQIDENLRVQGLDCGLDGE
ncbi:Chea signal transduction histidine kinase [Plakobranchus ocellatus]|uniref:Chea signal transduction histidine kinase n=1 Tax=Plakobranchus ocellatus TaxID=259542 RepID=A0AAV4BVY5_9GAST|nr:Chea signal transduction histidine kinase [Plakobranchus ocellatus]